MRHLQFRATLRTCTLLAALSLLPGSAAAADDSPIPLTNCDLNLPGTTWTAPARCGWFDVPENPGAPDGRQVRLRVAVVPAARKGAQADPLFLLSGGPGSAATESYVMLQWVLAKIREQRDIVLIDQRGTGQSSPLDCPRGTEDSLDEEPDPSTVRKLLLNCVEAQQGDPRYYTSTLAVGDFDAVRDALGYQQVNLLGMSYGTRTAQLYYRHHPQRVRSMILDGVVPMELNLGAEHAEMLDRSLQGLLAECAADADCGTRFPVEMDAVRKLVASLRDAPQQLDIIEPQTGKRKSLTVTGDVLAAAIRFLSYDSASQATLPLLLHEAIAEHRLDRLTAQAMMIVGNLSEMISTGMELTVTCSEDHPFMVAADSATAILGNSMLQRLDLACDVWPHIAVDRAFHEPVGGEVPVLLLSGSRDPVTPPSYAEQVAGHFPNHANLVGRGLGHGVLPNTCIRRIAEAFLASANPTSLDTSCLTRIEPAPFFASLLGPTP